MFIMLNIFLQLILIIAHYFLSDYVVSEDDSQFPLTFYRQQNSYKDNKPNPAEKEPHLILIVTFWRSGSSWLGQLISKAPKTFYSYEPIHMLINDSINDLGMNIPEPVKFAMVRQLFQCGVSTEFMRDYKRWNEIYPKRHCSGEDECPPLDITDVVDDCLNADYRIIKTVRLNLETVEDFFRLPSFRMLKVISSFEILVEQETDTYRKREEDLERNCPGNVFQNPEQRHHVPYSKSFVSKSLYFLRYEDMSLVLSRKL
ncbi:hypothetical protein Avbf_05246 [Armadillidium vulgare]|nr:hypothetical protein Avbf_05246 [Armadillidium vulgare]